MSDITEAPQRAAQVRWLRLGRRVVLVSLLAGMLGTITQLLDGSESGSRVFPPLALLILGILSLGWRLIYRCSSSVLLMQVCMIAFGVLGLVFASAPHGERKTTMPSNSDVTR